MLVNYILTFVIKWTVIADPSHTVVQMPAMSPTMVRYAKICEELSLKCYLHVCVCVLFLLLPRSFVILIVTILCRVKVTLQNGGRKKEIRSVIPKVSYDSERLKLSYFQFNVLKDNC